jgi:hypothetical protein
LQDLFDSSKKERRQTFVMALVVAVAISILAAPVVEAAVTKIKGTVNVKDSTGDAVESEATGVLGILQAPGSSGAVAVRNYAGGGGFLGAADCSAATALPDTVTINSGIVTGILVTGTNGSWAISAEAVDTLFGVPEGADFPVSNVSTSADNPNEFVGLGNGLTVTSPLKMKCTGTNGNLVVLGQ